MPESLGVAADRIQRFIEEHTEAETGERTQLESNLAQLWNAQDRRPRPKSEQVVRHVAEPPDRARVEIKESASGKSQISVRLTGDDPAKLTQDALAFFWSTRDQLDEGGIG